MEYLRLLASAVISAVVDLLGVFRRRRPPKLLVIKLDHLGDVVTATPVFRSLRAEFPDVPIHALVGPWARGLLAQSPFIDRVLVYESLRFRRRDTRADPRPPFRVMLEASAERYTHVIELRGDSWTLLLPFLTGARRRVDRGTVRLDRWLARRWLPWGSPVWAREPLHEVMTNLDVLRLLYEDPEPTPNRVEIFLAEEDRALVAVRLRALGIIEAPLITIHPGASWRPRAWRPERFAEVGRQLLARYDVHVLYVGTAEDVDIRDRISALLPDRRAHFLFDWRLTETAALIERSALFIGNDSGLAHIAAACGTPVIALYGPQDPRRFGPWSERAIVHHKPVPCFPCKQTVCVVPHNPCVNLIFVDEVMRSAETVLRPLLAGRSSS
jgi:lipopolysaccharide heptosyltransferase II